MFLRFCIYCPLTTEHMFDYNVNQADNNVTGSNVTCTRGNAGIERESHEKRVIWRIPDEEAAGKENTIKEAGFAA